MPTASSGLIVLRQCCCQKNLLDRPLHIVSANLHSFTTTIYGYHAMGKTDYKALEQLAVEIGVERKVQHARKIRDYALKHGLVELVDTSGTNISVQIIDTAQLPGDSLAPGITFRAAASERPVLLIMDYAFGEQAYECMDELLKPYRQGEEKRPLNVRSISIMGKAGILQGKRETLCYPPPTFLKEPPTTYPFENDLLDSDLLRQQDIPVCSGPMISVLGTSLQNKDVLRYFMKSSWRSHRFRNGGRPLPESDSGSRKNS